MQEKVVERSFLSKFRLLAIRKAGKKYFVVIKFVVSHLDDEKAQIGFGFL